MSTRVRRVINNTPYVCTPCKFGWRITSDAKPSDHFFRCYTVFTRADNGQPLRCSCPDAVYNGNAYCKHLREVSVMHAEGLVSRAEDPTAAPIAFRYVLSRQVLRYTFLVAAGGSVEDATVRVETSNDGVVLDTTEMHLQKARRLYAALVREGYAQC